MLEVPRRREAGVAVLRYAHDPQKAFGLLNRAVGQGWVGGEPELGLEAEVGGGVGLGAVSFGFHQAGHRGRVFPLIKAADETPGKAKTMSAGTKK